MYLHLSIIPLITPSQPIRRNSSRNSGITVIIIIISSSCGKNGSGSDS